MSSEPEPLAPPRGRGLAHAKIILLGEHAVVHGHPAIAVPLTGLGVTAEAGWSTTGEDAVESELLHRDAGEHEDVPLAAISAARRHFGLEQPIAVRVDSEIPAGRGLGSSAGTSTAIVRAIADLVDRPLHSEASFDLVQHAERVAHGTPSGLDARTTAASGPIRFQSGSAHEVRVGFDAEFVIADTGVHGNTRKAVTEVRRRLAEQPEAAEAALDRLGAIAATGEQVLSRADGAPELGVLMDEAQGLLETLGVSSPEIEALVAAARGAGALGAKLSGGGQGGCVLALVPAGASATVERALREAGATGLHRFDTRTFQQ